MIYAFILCKNMVWVNTACETWSLFCLFKNFSTSLSALLDLEGNVHMLNTSYLYLVIRTIVVSFVGSFSVTAMYARALKKGPLLLQLCLHGPSVCFITRTHYLYHSVTDDRHRCMHFGKIISWLSEKSVSKTAWTVIFWHKINSSLLPTT